tara:strand:- start:819 stop:1013 length:195 start_codon:yes stop_codon:yes gene_type:complete
MSIELEEYEAEECIEALKQSVLSLEESINNIPATQRLTIKAIQKVIDRQEALAETLQSRVWESM